MKRDRSRQELDLLREKNPEEGTMSARELKREAKESATFRGHVLGKWTNRDHGTVAYTSCTQCGLGVYVTAKPAANEASVMGQAVATNCQEPTR